MKTIVKYSNRKLYDKDTAQYTTIGELIKLPMGTFKVERYGTGEDVTTDTLLSSLSIDNLGSEIKIEVMKHCITELQVCQ